MLDDGGANAGTGQAIAQLYLGSRIDYSINSDATACRHDAAIAECVRSSLGLAGAKQLAEELLKALSSMVSALQNMRQQARGGAMDALSQQLQQSSNALADLAQRQEHILENTQHIDQEALQQLNHAQQQAFDAVQQQLQQELNKLTKLSWELSRQARQYPSLDAAFQQVQQQLSKHLQTLRQHVDSRDMPQALQD
jgi:DNA repair exonuclease SbcCD ATPase subunit